ncbi:putative reverse transcriptase domain-containing protein [Tanacetum coccineum]
MPIRFFTWSFIFGSFITSTTISMRSSHQLCSSVPSIPYSSAAITERPSYSSFADPSRKRSRSPTTSVLIYSHILGVLSSVCADLLPPCKRIRSSDYVTDLEVSSDESSESYVPRESGSRVDVDAGEVVVESVLERNGSRLSVQGAQLRTMPNTRSGATMTRGVVNELIAHRVAEALEARNVARNLKPLAKGGMNRETKMVMIMMVEMEEEMKMIHNVNFGGFMPLARECTSQDFLKCQPLNFNGTEGVIGLTRWFEKIETRNEIQKMETELWNLTVKGNDLTAYTMRFQELVMLCTRMVSNEEDKVERFIGGLPDNIQGNVNAAEPTRLQDTIRIANNLMDQKLKGYAKSAENKRRFDNNPRENSGQQPAFKRQNVGGCTMKGRVLSGHYRKDCPKLRNQNRGNKTGSNEATARAYAIVGEGGNPDSNVVTGTFLLNNCYASMLFNSGADRSFVSSTFSALLDVAPSTLDTICAVELADGRISETNVILKGCTLGLLGHLLDIDLMLIELGSFDFIIGMDWLAKYHAMIVCDKKIVRIPYGDEEDDDNLEVLL